MIKTLKDGIRKHGSSRAIVYNIYMMYNNISYVKNYIHRYEISYVTLKLL